MKKSFLLEESKFNSAWVLTGCLLAFGIGTYLSELVGIQTAFQFGSDIIFVAIVLDISIGISKFLFARREAQRNVE